MKEKTKECLFEMPVQIYKHWIEKSTEKSKDKEEEWFIEGYAAVEGEDQSDPPVYLTKEALKAAESSMDERNKIILQHDTYDTEKLVGKVVEHRFIDEQPSKIWFKGLISKAEGEVWQKVKEGILDGISLGGSVLKYEQSYDEKLRRWVTKILQFVFKEISLVILPANVACRVTDWSISKSLNIAIKNHKEGGDTKMGDDIKKTEDTKSTEEETKDTEKKDEENTEKKEGTEDVKSTEEKKDEENNEDSENKEEEKSEKVSDEEVANVEKSEASAAKNIKTKLNQLVKAINDILSEIGDEKADTEKSENTETDINKTVKELKKSQITEKDIVSIVTDVLAKIPDIKKAKLTASDSVDEEKLREEWRKLSIGEKIRLKLSLKK